MCVVSNDYNLRWWRSEFGPITPTNENAIGANSTSIIGSSSYCGELSFRDRKIGISARIPTFQCLVKQYSTYSGATSKRNRKKLLVRLLYLHFSV